MAALWRVLVSMRTTAVVMAVLAGLLALRVVVPQADGATAEAHAALLARGGPWPFLLVTLELGRIPTSRIFLLALWAFFLSLAAVLVDRTGATLRRCAARSPDDGALRAWVARAPALAVPLAPGADPAWPATVLARLGYRVARPTAGTTWGLRNRLAPLGFPLFHASFFLLCAGGAALYYTRTVATLAAVEGQEVDAASAAIVRRAPAMAPPALRLVVERIEPRLADGKPVDLAAVVRREVEGAPASPPVTARINAPAVFGPVSVLTERAGVAPVLRVTSADGATRDRVAVVASGDAPTPLAGGALVARVRPIPLGPGFPERAALPTAKVHLALSRGGQPVYEGDLGPGARVELGELAVQVDGVRYWVGLRLVHEQGGPLLVAGFLLGVVGIAWRMLWYRREVAIVADADRLRVVGRAEFFPDRFRGELEAIAALLANPEPVVRPGSTP